MQFTGVHILLLVAFQCVAAETDPDVPCAGSWENCSASMCCSTPFFECVEKNVAGEKDGQYVSPYAQCRNSNHTKSCPCDNPPCIDYSDDYKLKIKMPWSCVVLTGGCSAAFKPCGPGHNLNDEAKKTWHGTPCCQWGCTCDYNVSWSAVCKPPHGLYACTKDAEKETRAHNEDEDTEIMKKYTISDHGMYAPHTRSDGGKNVANMPYGNPLPLFAAIAGSVVLVSSAALVLRRKIPRSVLYDEAPVDAEGDVCTN